VLCDQSQNVEVGRFYFAPDDSNELIVYENDHWGSKKSRGDGSGEELFPRAVKRFSLYPSNDKFGRADGLRYTTMTVEDALNRAGNDAFHVEEGGGEA
jgi:hypothetical protein